MITGVSLARDGKVSQESDGFAGIQLDELTVTRERG